MRHHTPEEITGWSWVIAWLEVLPALAAVLSTPLLVGAITSWRALAGVALLALASLVIVIALIMYAATRSPRPVVLRLCTYGCPVAAVIAILNPL